MEGEYEEDVLYDLPMCTSNHIDVLSNSNVSCASSSVDMHESPRFPTSFLDDNDNDNDTHSDTTMLAKSISCTDMMSRHSRHSSTTHESLHTRSTSNVNAYAYIPRPATPIPTAVDKHTSALAVRQLIDGVPESPVTQGATHREAEKGKYAKRVTEVVAGVGGTPQQHRKSRSAPGTPRRFTRRLYWTRWGKWIHDDVDDDNDEDEGVKEGELERDVSIDDGVKDVAHDDLEAMMVHGKADRQQKKKKRTWDKLPFKKIKI